MGSPIHEDVGRPAGLLSTMKRSALFISALLIAVGVIAGCSDQKAEFGDKKEDWQKTNPPTGWKGPGQAGAPNSGPIGGPPEGK